MSDNPFGKLDAKRIEQLAAPFDPSELEWRAIQFSKEGTSAMAYAYINPRAVEDRLDEVFPGEWSLFTEVLAGDQQFKAVVRAVITIGDVSRSGIGEAEINYKTTNDGRTIVTGEPFKSAESDAIKRAAVGFGIGRYLYSLPAPWIEWEGDRQWGNFKVDPASVVFAADGSVTDAAKAKSGRRGSKPKSAAAVVPAATAPAPVAAPVATPPPAPAPVAAPAAPVAPPAAAPPAAVVPVVTNPANAGIDPIQTAWITALYTNAGMAPPADLGTWTRKQAAQHMHEAIVAGGNADAPSVPQIEVVSKNYTKRGEDFPINLAQLTKKTISPVIQSLLGTSN